MESQPSEQKPIGSSSLHEIRTLAFIYLHEHERDLFRGGILVLDPRGKPLEFRCTSPIQPNAVQRALYGNTLRSHMAIELVGNPLLTALREKPQVLLVKQEEFLELRQSLGIPVLMVAKQGGTAAVADKNPKPVKQELLTNPTARFEPVVLTSHWQHPNDLAETTDSLRSLFSCMDIAEPFSRVSSALKLLHEKGAVPSK